jgi:hypothetical protein
MSSPDSLDSIGRRMPARAAAPSTAQYVQAEFRGQARAARDAFLAGALRTGPLMRAIVADAEAAYKNRTTNIPLRLIQSVAARWRSIDRAGCLSQMVTITGRTLEIRDVRATASIASNADWDADEKGICLIANSLRCRKTSMIWDAPLLAGLSLHTLGRFHARALDNSPEALLYALKLLAAEAPGIIAAQVPTFAVPTGNGGSFRGHLAQSPDGFVFLDTRTFSWD